MNIHNSFHDRQSQPESVDSLRRTQTHELGEDAFPLLAADAAARVAHREGQTPPHHDLAERNRPLVGEFLGVVEAAKYIIEHRFSPAIIYTDSLTALTWFNEKRTASRKRNAALKKAEIFLKAMASEIDKIEVLHWNNSLWGETPADFGEK